MRTFFVLLFALSAFGCSSCEDEVPTAPATDDVREEQEAPPTPSTCGGCEQDGQCRPGDRDDACGQGGQMCVACGVGESCVDGTCETAMMPQDCSPDTCDGCCNTEGRCVAGGQQDACGAGGAQCLSCAVGEQCRDGACEGPMTAMCGPANCDGCCDAAGVCQAGGAVAACGAQGGQCDSCAGGETCQGGVCVGAQPTCATTCAGCCDGEVCVTAVDEQQCGAAGGMCVACAADESCVNGACTPPVNPPTGEVWNIILVSAEIAPTKPNGQAWDSFGGAPDPYMYMYSEDNVALYYWEYESLIAVDEFAPFWDEVMFIEITSQALSEGIFFNLIDDELGPDDICYQVEVIADPAAVANRDIVTTCQMDPRTTWTWRIEPAP